MAETVYNYSISGDVTAGAVRTDQLEDEIHASTIIIAVERIDTDGDNLDVVMKDALSTGDKTTLDSVVQNHVPVYPDKGLKKTPITKRLEVANYEPEGDFLTYVSHDWTDPTTWYNDAQEITNETLTQVVAGELYDGSKDYWIDLTHGRLFEEDNLSYPVKVYDNGTPLIEDSHYSIDYAQGRVSAIAPYVFNGPVTADYWYEAGSTYVLKPNTGKILKIKKAEIQFTEDLVMKKIYWEVWGYDPNNPPNKIMYQRRIYKTIKDIIAIGNLGQGKIEAFDIFTSHIRVFPFDYNRSIDLQDSLGLEMRIHIPGGNSNPMTGEWATITFYTAEEDE